MIIEWLVAVGSGFAQWVAGLFPVLEIPEQISSADEQIEGLLEGTSGLAPWGDWPFLFMILAVPLVVWVLALVIRGVRALLAHIPFIGGKG